MNNKLLQENQKKRIAVSPLLLCCYALFSVWQMGVVYFSGTALSLNGRVPLPVTVENTTMLIAAAYITSILYLIFFQRHSVMMARIVIGAAFLSALALYLPLPPQVLAGLYYAQIYCCVFMIGVGISIVVNLFTENTELLDVIITAVLGNLLIAALQNDKFPVPFPVFQAFTVAALALLLFFYCRLPSKQWPQYAVKADDLTSPKRFSAGLFLLIGLSCILTLFGSAVAEGVPHGVSVSYLAACVTGVIICLVWKVRGISPLQSAAIFVGAAMLGFILNAVAPESPVLSLVSCALIGGGMTVCNLSSYFGIVLSKRYPSRWITPMIIALALSTVLLHSVLLEGLRTSPRTLYAIYAVISACMAVLYFLLEPMLVYAQSRTPVELAPIPIDIANPVVTETPVAAAIPVAAAVTESQPQKANHTPEQPPRPAAFVKLSGQEYRLASLILDGYTNAEMASLLKITEGTVKSYRKTLYSKLQIHSKRELCALAKEQPVEK